MKIKNLSTTLRLPLNGEGGYNNQSQLFLSLKEGFAAPDYLWANDAKYANQGRLYANGVDVPDPWDLNWLVGQLDLLEGFSLDIPSGVLSAATPPTAVEFDREAQDILISYATGVTWDGKHAGLLGGMSGFCSFGVAFHEAIVIDGTYMKFDEDFVDYIPYLRRINIHTLIAGYEWRCKKAAMFLNGEISRQEWDSYLTYLSELGDREAIALSREGGHTCLKIDAPLKIDGSYNECDDIFDEILPTASRRKRRRQVFEEA